MNQGLKAFVPVSFFFASGLDHPRVPSFLAASLAVLEPNPFERQLRFLGMGGCLSFLCNYDILITCFFCINVSSLSLKYVRTLSSNIFKFFTQVIK